MEQDLQVLRHTEFSHPLFSCVSVCSEAVVQSLLAVAKGHNVVPITVNQSEKHRGFVSAPSRAGPGAAGLSLRRCPLSSVAHFLLLKAGGRKFGFFVC